MNHQVVLIQVGVLNDLQAEVLDERPSVVQIDVRVKLHQKVAIHPGQAAA